MTPEQDSERIRALLRAAHEGDELSCPPFQRLARDATREASSGSRALRAAAIAALAAVASAAAVIVSRREEPPSAPTSAVVAVALPLEFLLDLPYPSPAEAFPSLRVAAPADRSGPASNQRR